MEIIFKPLKLKVISVMFVYFKPTTLPLRLKVISVMIPGESY
jgi:hypothetical protein